MSIHLHCFTHGRRPGPELGAYCASVHLYPRLGPLPGLPYMVASRRSRALVRRLDADDYPILFEGIHTTYSLLSRGGVRWPGRTVMVRLHNVEARYYGNLAALQTGWLRKAYLALESLLLRRYEQRIARLPVILLPLHPADAEYFRAAGGADGASTVDCLPAFTAYQDAFGLPGKGAYVLYHGDLTVADNVRSAQWLMHVVHREEQGPWIIAGNGPGRALRRAVARARGIRLLASPDEATMEDCIRGAHVHLIHSFNPSGIKVKLLHALRAGRHCVVLENLVKGTGLEPLCTIVRSAQEYREAISKLKDVPVTESDLRKRREVLKAHADARAGARQIIGYLHPGRS